MHTNLQLNNHDTCTCDKQCVLELYNIASCKVLETNLNIGYIVKLNIEWMAFTTLELQYLFKQRN